MVKKARRRQNEKNPAYLRGVEGDVQTEINVLQARLDQGDVPENKISTVEMRICTLMNQTLPKVKERLDKALHRKEGP